ncbi:hypothetical protein IFR05_015623 [Cadophora sp. M221]|nr:hypothetical protein IFR05_015623 [Cadophora sp. M221]
MSCYEPLNPTRKEIRNLILQPRTSGTEIQCSTSTISLLQSPEYEALSYVWGDASIPETITFNDIPTKVTKNLYAALTYLRHPDKPRYLWVDALCINQKDLRERNEQVAMMGEVYTSAKPVLVWLGEADEGSDEAFALLPSVLTDNNVQDGISQKLFSFYMQLMDRDWFTRLWTIQELVLASQDPLVGCGHTWTTWSTLFSAWQKIAMIEFSKMGMVIYSAKDEKQGEDEAEPMSITQGVRPKAIKIDLLNNLRSGMAQHHQNQTFRDLILNTNSSNATEPRDRIYGLLGMLPPPLRQEFTVDYARPLGTVFAEAVAHIFRHGKGAFLLSGMDLTGSSSNPTFPSWVPRFGDKMLLKPTRFHPPGIGASGAGADAVNGSVDEDLKTLRIRGIPIDTVLEKISIGEGYDCLRKLPQIEKLANRARELALQNAAESPEVRSYLAPFKTKEPLWRTLIANKAYSGGAREVAPDSYEDMYRKLLDIHTMGLPEKEIDNEDESIREYRLCLLNILKENCAFITSTGFCGIGPDSVEKRDQLVILFGAPAPFVLRDIHNGLAGDREGVDGEMAYNVCGVVYVAGVMDGEIVDEVYCEDLEDDVAFVVR